MRISATPLHALLHVRRVIEQVKAMEQLTLTPWERDVVRESLERAYDRAESLLTPQVIQVLVSEVTRGEERKV